MLAHLDNLNERLLVEEEASREVSYSTRLEVVAPAATPTEPSRNVPGILMLAGCFLGWLVGLMIVIQGKEKGTRR
jgi:uncharacterized protein involved in exopolysaccharide biosynthesis